MHIPESETQELNILSFQEALQEKSAQYDREHWIYVPDHYDQYRYLLGTRGSNPLICIGINPSTAEPGALDNTLKSVQRIAEGNGFDSFLMFNVYAQRATRPDDMDRICNTELHRENMEAFRYVMTQVGKEYRPAVWAAWGTIIEKRPYLPDCVRDMVHIGEEYGARWLCAGKCSKKGHPHHPLYLRKDEQVRDFPVLEYLDSLSELQRSIRKKGRKNT